MEIPMIDGFFSWLDPQWVARQFYSGDAVPMIVWTAASLSAGFAAGRAFANWRRFRTGRFTPRQLHAIYECYRSSFGSYGFKWFDADNFEVMQLVEIGVMFGGASRVYGGVERRQYRLTPDWYEHVRKHEGRFRRLCEESEKAVSLDR